MEQTAKLLIDGKTYELPVIEGTEGEKAIDITRLRQDTGLITYDPGYANTGACKSSITFMNGEKGILRYRGYPVEELAERSTFVETAFLLINGELPARRELTRFSVMLNDHSLVHEDMREFYQNFPRRAHPMGILSSMVNALRFFYPELPDQDEEINITTTRLLSKVRIDSPMCESPDYFVALSSAAYKRFKDTVPDDGVIIYDPAFVEETDKRLKCDQRAFPAKELSVKHSNNALFSNTLVLGHLARTIDALDKEVVLESILEIIPKFHDRNKEAYEIGYKYKS